MIKESDYSAALDGILKRGVAKSIRVMLLAHLTAPKRVTTMRRLGDAAGMSQKHTNTLYGQFAGRVRRELQQPRKGIELGSIAVWPEEPIDAAGEFSFRMREPFAKALANSGMLAGIALPAHNRPMTGGRNRSPSEELYEGTIRRSQATRWERSGRARQDSIDFFGCECQACGFSFERRYGELGRSFIEVHHVTQYARDHGRRRVDGKTDLVPVCSNCHKMLHKQDPPLSVRELRTILGRRDK